MPLEFSQEDDTKDYYDLARQIMAEEPPDEWLEQHDNLTLEELMESLKNMGPKKKFTLCFVYPLEALSIIMILATDVKGIFLSLTSD